MKILFICTGNSCRSVMGHFLMLKLAKDRGLELEVKSAGTAAQAHYPVPLAVRKSLEKYELPPFFHRPTPIDEALMKWADLVLAMSEKHVSHLKKNFSGHTEKVALLREKAGLGREEVEDPIGQSDEFYDAVLEKIREAVEKILDEITDSQPSA